MIEVRYKARLGNNMFQYCLGRILAEELGFALKADLLPGFPNTMDAVDGERHDRPECTLNGQQIDLGAMLSDRSPRRVVLDGWFQRHEYYRPYREKIRKWLMFDDGVRAAEAKPDVVVNVRRTDFVQLGWALPFSYYEAAIERVLPTGGKVCIVTDDADDPFFSHFGRWHPQFISGTALEQMLFMARSRRLVMSQSTFCWWPTFLGDVAEVVCPVPAFGAWSPNGEAADSNLIERDRFICIECREPYEPTPAEARHQRKRLLKRRMISKINRSLGLSLTVPPP
jgi:hypothetical protein